MFFGVPTSPMVVMVICGCANRSAYGAELQPPDLIDLMLQPTGEFYLNLCVRRGGR